MKSSLFIFSALGAATYLFAGSVGAQTNQMFVTVDGGAAWQQDVNAQDGSKIKFDTGIRGDLIFGYNFHRDFAAEFETGVIANSINSLEGTSLSAYGANAEIYEVPLLVNLVYRVPVKGSWIPFVGAGAGGAVTFFEGSNIPLFGYGGNASYSDADFTFAYQASAGLRYVVSPRFDWGVTYKFMGTTSHSWSDNGVVFNSDGTMTHAILATFNWNF